MQAVCETHAFRRAAIAAGMSEDDSAALVGYRAETPDAITFYSGAMMPVYLLTVFGKGEKAYLSDAECNALRALTKAIAAEHIQAVTALAARKGKKK